MFVTLAHKADEAMLLHINIVHMREDSLDAFFLDHVVNSIDLPVYLQIPCIQHTIGNDSRIVIADSGAGRDIADIFRQFVEQACRFKDIIGVHIDAVGNIHFHMCTVRGNI